MNLQVAGFLDNSMVNGTGLRSVIFLSGCKHNCKGCHNPEMQDFKYGESIPVEELYQRVMKNYPLINKVTISGGDPMEQSEGLIELLEKLKEQNFNVWLYTGYTHKELLDSEDNSKSKLLKYVDTLVDGKFDENLFSEDIKFIGSSNQNIIQL